MFHKDWICTHTLAQSRATVKGPLPECIVPEAKTTQVEARIAIYVWFTVSYLNYVPWQTNHRRYAWWLKLLRVRAMPKLRSRNSAHDLDVVYACVAILAVLADSRQSQTLLPSMVCVPWYKSTQCAGSFRLTPRCWSIFLVYVAKTPVCYGDQVV